MSHFQNVFLTDQEQTELQADFPAVWQEYIEHLSGYMASTGKHKQYHSHAATMKTAAWGIVSLDTLKNRKEPPMEKLKESVITVSTVFVGRQADRQTSPFYQHTGAVPKTALLLYVFTSFL